MASRLRLFAAGPTPGAVGDSDPNPGASGKAAAAGGREGEAKRPDPPRREVTDLGGGSEVVHVPRFVAREKAWEWFDYLDKTIPWTRPPLRVFGRSSIQPRETCYVADEGLTELKYSGYKPHVYFWDEFPVLKDILKAVHEALPGSYFNSLLLNRYKNGSDYVSWHADDEPLYGPTPEIASVSFGCERDFILRKKPSKSQATSGSGEAARKRLKVAAPQQQQHSFLLKHGSLLVMRGLHPAGLAPFSSEASQGKLTKDQPDFPACTDLNILLRPFCRAAQRNFYGNVKRMSYITHCWCELVRREKY